MIFAFLHCICNNIVFKNLKYLDFRFFSCQHLYFLHLWTISIFKYDNFRNFRWKEEYRNLLCIFSQIVFIIKRKWKQSRYKCQKYFDDKFRDNIKMPKRWNKNIVSVKLLSDAISWRDSKAARTFYLNGR